MQTSIDLKTIKLVIWDLDNTLWNGILTEGRITDNENNYDFVRKLTDIGIINSICSKNDVKPVEKELERIGLSDYFVFKSISWETKGYRVQKIIEDMHLRPVNVLFLDDDKRNLNEVKNKLPDINCALPDIIPDLQKQIDASFKIDIGHKRLNQYKVLEKKQVDSQKFGKDTDFLKSCEIEIYIGRDCEQKSDRIYELMQRANQLNYTKLRSSKEEFEALLCNAEFECAYIACKDKYGDYGIVGFYALDNSANRLVHFLFSCRTLGMGVETFVYHLLKKPTLEFVGYVVNDLTEACPDWITVSENDFDSERPKSDSESTKNGIDMLFKGPCDLYIVEKFFPKNLHITTEFTYMNEEKFSVESFNHSSEIVASAEYSKEQKESLIMSLPFLSPNYYDTKIFSKKWNVVVLSMLCDYGLGLYRNKYNGLQFVHGQYTRNLLDEANDEFFTKKAVPPVEKSVLSFLRDNYEFQGRISNDSLLKNLAYIRRHLPKETLLILLGGAEFPFVDKDGDLRKDRHIIHRECNAIVKKFCMATSNCEFIDVNPFIMGKESFMDTISHYVNPVYFEIAQSIVSVVNEHFGSGAMQNISSGQLVKVKIFRMIRFFVGFIPRSVRISLKKRLGRI